MLPRPRSASVRPCRSDMVPATVRSQRRCCWLRRTICRLRASMTIRARACSAMLAPYRPARFVTVRLLARARSINTGLYRGGGIPRQLEPQPAPPQFLGNDQRRAAASKRIQYHFPRVGRNADDAAQQLFGHLAAVPAGPLLEGAAHAGE